VIPRAFVVATCAALLAGCSSSSPSTPTTTPAPGVAPALAVEGDPESPQGATWSYRGTIDGTSFDLHGILLKPRGSGPFPAVILSHGAGGSATAYSRGVAQEMVQWGLVCIATNYTHAGGVPLGAPGTSNEPGASQANVLRGHAVHELLRGLGYVDMSRVAAHGHSMGAFVTTALTGAYPFDFRVASHTAGGVRPDAGGATGAAAPTDSQARAARAPYQVHHGDADVVVPIAMDQRFVAMLQSSGVTHEFHVYPGGSHDDVARNATVLSRVRAWYAAHGLF
jgi:dienelactone hydrolase